MIGVSADADARVRAGATEKTNNYCKTMFVSMKRGSFQACPEFAGRGVLADFTPLKPQQSQFGEREVFKGVVEVDLLREDGSPYCVWTNNMTPSLHEKANLRKFLKSVLGRELTREELKGFDLETLIGLPVHVVVVQEHKDGETYANIAVIQPHKTGEPLKLSGKYVRVKDRALQPATMSAPNGAGAQGGYRRAAPLPTEAGGDHLTVKIHVGRCKGLELRDLALEQVAALVEKWLPTAQANAKPTADDKRLIAALEWWQAAPAGTAAEDDVQY